MEGDGAAASPAREDDGSAAAGATTDSDTGWQSSGSRKAPSVTYSEWEQQQEKAPEGSHAEDGDEAQVGADGRRQGRDGVYNRTRSHAHGKVMQGLSIVTHTAHSLRWVGQGKRSARRGPATT